MSKSAATLALTVVALMASPAAASAQVASDGAAGASERVYVGKLTGTSAYIGFSVVGRHVLVYVCDGNERSRRAQTISACFRGRYKGTRIALNGKNGQRLAARVNRRGITGSVRVRKIGKLQRFEFAVKRARGAARFLYGIQPESPPEQSSALPAHGYVRGRVDSPARRFRAWHEVRNGALHRCKQGASGLHRGPQQEDQ